MSWLTSRTGAITLSVFAFMTFLGRGFMDWRYEYPLQDPSGSWDLPVGLIYMLLAGGWVWALVAASNDSRRGIVAITALALVLNVILALATFFIFCPFWSDCEGWPNAWLWNWANLLTGVLAVGAGLYQLRRASDL